MALDDALRDFRLNAYYRDPGRNRSSFISGNEGAALWFYERPIDRRTFLIRSQAPWIIEQIQRAFGANPIDGRFGPNTLQAVRAGAAREGITFPNQLTPDMMSYALRKAFHRGVGLVGMPLQFELPNVDHPVRAPGRSTFLGSIDVMTGQSVGMGANGQPVTPTALPTAVQPPPSPQLPPPGPASPPVGPTPPLPVAPPQVLPRPAPPSSFAPRDPTGLQPAPSPLPTAPAPRPPVPAVPRPPTAPGTPINISAATMGGGDGLSTAFGHIFGPSSPICPPCHTEGPGGIAAGQCKPMDPRDCDQNAYAAEVSRRQNAGMIIPVLGVVGIVSGGLAIGIAVKTRKDW